MPFFNEKTLSLYKNNHAFMKKLLFIAVLMVFCMFACKKETTTPPTTWEKTFTPYLENNNQRDTVYDDENITFSTDQTPSDRYIWSWGDGSKNDTTQTIYAIHQFRRIGLNIIKLRVERGNTYGENTDSVWVIHHAIPPCGFRIDSNDSLYIRDTAHFVANIATPDCQSTCSFSYQWDFGDGKTGTGYHTTHAYDSTGTFTVKVKIARCESPDTIAQKTVVVSGSTEKNDYKCQCVTDAGTFAFFDTIEVQNLPYNPIKVAGRVLQRLSNSNRYFGEFNCKPTGCDTYMLDVFDSQDSVQYRFKTLFNFYAINCSGKRL
jgi:hypothetical protein